MFLSEFRIGGFKAFNETQRLPIKPITLIFGPNSGGKSSLIHALLFAHEAVVNEKLDVHQTQIGGESVDLGGFANYAYGHDVARDVELGFRLPKPALSNGTGPVTDSELNVTSRVACSREPYVRSCSIDGDFLRLLLTGSAGELSLVEIDGEPTGHYWVYKTREVHPDEHEVETPDFEPVRPQWEGGPTYNEWTPIREVGAERAGLVPRELTGTAEDGVPKLRGWLQDGKRVAAPWLASDELPGYLSYEEWAKRKGFSIQTEAVDFGAIGESADTETADEAVAVPSEDPRSQYEAFIQRLRDSQETVPKRAIPLEAELNDIVKTVHGRLSRCFGSFRYLGPFRSYPARQLPTPGAYDPNFNATGASAWYRVRADEEVRDAVNRWLGSEHMQTPYELVRGDPAKLELLLTDVRRNLPVSHRDIGIGVSQVLPVLVEAYSSSGATIVIEQPEIHLHPRLQAALGDVFIKAALSERENTFVIETHSEHLILRLLRRIREKAVRPEDVSVVYVEPTDSGSRVIEMELSDDGQLVSAWPGGFFEEGFRERFGD